MASFEEILNMPSADIKPPQAYPVGTYHCLVDGPGVPGKSSQKQTDQLTFKFKILAPMKDVNAEAAAEQQVVGKTITSDYYITDTAVWRTKELCDHAGIPEEKMSLKERIAQLPGKQVLVTLRHENSQDGKRVYHRVASTAHV